MPRRGLAGTRRSRGRALRRRTDGAAWQYGRSSRQAVAVSWRCWSAAIEALLSRRRRCSLVGTRRCSTARRSRLATCSSQQPRRSTSPRPVRRLASHRRHCSSVSSSLVERLPLALAALALAAAGRCQRRSHLSGSASSPPSSASWQGGGLWPSPVVAFTGWRHLFALTAHATGKIRMTRQCLVGRWGEPALQTVSDGSRSWLQPDEGTLPPLPAQPGLAGVDPRDLFFWDTRVRSENTGPIRIRLHATACHCMQLSCVWPWALVETGKCIDCMANRL